MPKANSVCLICKATFYTKPAHKKMGWGKYCGLECRHESQLNGKDFKCHNCGKIVYRTIREQKRSKSNYFFCSKSCQTRWRNTYFSNSRHANWRGGKSIYRKLLREASVKQSCFLCGIEDKEILTAHHKDHKRTNNKVENLLWLCLNCHYKVHHDKELDKFIRNTPINTKKI